MPTTIKAFAAPPPARPTDPSAQVQPVSAVAGGSGCSEAACDGEAGPSVHNLPTSPSQDLSFARLPVHVESRIDRTAGCWLWSGRLTEKGYGRCHIEGKERRVHRYIFEKTNGPVPDGMELDHLCRVRHCVNPEHLEVVTSRVNILRGKSLAALNAAKTHCKRGHEFNRANTIKRKGGRSRACRACLEEQRRRREVAQ